ncbi:hypothetical protein J6590_029806 [Homalodisca vitripennis]|nr:hypothetical protein J6590_029806 [Homalodisca vitripennis]
MSAPAISNIYFVNIKLSLNMDCVEHQLRIIQDCLYNLGKSEPTRPLIGSPKQRPPPSIKPNSASTKKRRKEEKKNRKLSSLQVAKKKELMGGKTNSLKLTLTHTHPRETNVKVPDVDNDNTDNMKYALHHSVIGGSLAPASSDITRENLTPETETSLFIAEPRVHLRKPPMSAVIWNQEESMEDFLSIYTNNSKEHEKGSLNKTKPSADSTTEAENAIPQGLITSDISSQRKQNKHFLALDIPHKDRWKQGIKGRIIINSSLKRQPFFIRT